MPPPLSTPDVRSRAALEALEALVRNFDRDSAGYSRSIRELVQKDREAFYAASLQILASGEDSRGSQFLVSILDENRLLLRALGDASLTLQQAMALARVVGNVQMVDVLIARHLAECAETLGDAACPPEMQRLMEILSSMPEGARILPFLMTLTRRPNPHLQSKAVLLIGRINRSVKWALNRLSEPDLRVRANAIESLWGVDNDDVRMLLHSAANDGNNRVAGNALIALYQLGDCWSISQILAMANHESRRFRATAAWVMGRTGDPRFTRELARLVGERDGAVRTRAFAALGQVKAASAQARLGQVWLVVARPVTMPYSGSRELHVAVCSKDGEQIQVLPTQFILTENAHTVVDYTVERRDVHRGLAVAFLYPRCAEPAAAPFNQGALQALPWKGPSDLWSAVPYLPTASAETQATFLDQKIAIAVERVSTPSDLPLQFSCDPAALGEAFLSVPSKMDCGDLWNAVRRSLQVKNGAARGQRHLIVYSQRETNSPNSYSKLISAAHASRTSVHAILLAPNSALEGLSEATQGTCQTVASPEEVPSLVERIYLSLIARYGIRYQPVNPDEHSLGIRVQSPDGWGETTVLV